MTYIKNYKINYLLLYLIQKKIIESKNEYITSRIFSRKP